MITIDFEEITLRLDVSRRGGGIEIDLSSLGYPGEKMTAYQNYLGGGMLGSIGSSNTINARHKFVELSVQEDIDEISEELKRYFHYLTNPDDEWEGMTYEERQRMPRSAY